MAISENGTYDCNHPDLKINSITTKLAPETLKAHTTAVAGVVGASINGQGSAGVAPEVNLISKDVNFKTRLDASPIVPDADIINCSFSYTKIGWHKSFGLAKANSDDALLINTIKTQIENGRSGLGTIVVFASGNQRDENGNSNYCAAKTLPYIITVGGIDKTTDIGRFEKPYKPFSNPGANLLVSAPCYQIFSTTLKLFNDYNSTFGNPHGEMFGTSFATPIVSGVIALMLQANPFLGVRDVHNILAYSAKMIEGSSGKWLFNKSKYYNGGGLHYNYDYGFGNIDATTAVRLAESWVNQNVKFKMLPIVFRDGGAMNFSKIFSAKIQKNIPNFQLEKVQLDLEGTNIKLDEVTISLTSPSGTLSVLSEARALQNPDGTKFTLDGSISPLTNHFLGEDFSGTWHIKIEAEGAKSENSSRLTAETTIGQFGKIAAYFYGTTTLNYTYVFTNEAASVYSNERSNITCPNGINTINLASLSSACEVNLQHHKLKIMNNDYIITPESKVHNIFGGEGDDIIMGNELDNILVGGRGNNIIKGNSGHNIICGGKGNNDLYSGQDADMFVIHKIPGSHNRIFDFKPYLAQEVINIVGFDKSKSFSDLIFEQKNENLLITLEEQTFMLMNTAKESIKKENFIFDEHFNFHAQFAGDHLEWSSALEHTIYQA